MDRRAFLRQGGGILGACATGIVGSSRVTGADPHLIDTEAQRSGDGTLLLDVILENTGNDGTVTITVQILDGENVRREVTETVHLRGGVQRRISLTIDVPNDADTSRTSVSAPLIEF